MSITRTDRVIQMQLMNTSLNNFFSLSKIKWILFNFENSGERRNIWHIWEQTIMVYLFIIYRSITRWHILIEKIQTKIPDTLCDTGYLLCLVIYVHISTRLSAVFCSTRTHFVTTACNILTCTHFEADSVP